MARRNDNHGHHEVARWAPAVSALRALSLGFTAGSFFFFDNRGKGKHTAVHATPSSASPPVAAFSRRGGGDGGPPVISCGHVLMSDIGALAANAAWRGWDFVVYMCSTKATKCCGSIFLWELFFLL